VKAAVITAPPQLDITELPEPIAGPGEVVIRVTGCGICGSDLHIAANMSGPGTVLGHEIAGVVEELGPDVDNVQPGDAVAVRPFVGCGHCGYCKAGRHDHCASFQLVGMQRPGGFAERTAVNAAELFKLPTGVHPDDHALVEPFAVARHGLRRGGLVQGETVIITGAGPIGLATAHWARALGAGRIIVSDPLEHRRQLALALGADEAVDPQEVAALGAAPLVVECSGKPGVVDQAMQLAAIGGRVAVVGVCMANDSYFPWWGLNKELDVRFCLYYDRHDFTETIDAFEIGALRPEGLVTERIGLDELPERFARLAREGDAGKVVLVP
jgi:(R,R)-butanediol dehydrogenase/meso-butanediol dehydrogenase/diacetyl reductase